MLHDMGIEEERVRLEWISAAEGEKVKQVINEMVEQLRALGPLDVPGKFADWDQELLALQQHVDQASEKEVVHAH
jgi:F420-non-reducing hydrogenase iron-sulfur subunit